MPQFIAFALYQLSARKEISMQHNSVIVRVIVYRINRPMK